MERTEPTLPTAALLSDGTDEVVAQLVGQRPASAGRKTAADLQAAAQLSAAQASRAVSSLDHVQEAEAAAVDEDRPMTEAEIRVLEEDPPPPPVQAELPLQFPTKGPGVYTTYRGPDERKAYLSDKKELRRLEELKQIYAQLADKARDAKGTLEIEEEKLRDLRAEAATNMSLAPQKLFYQEQEVEQAWARLTDAETRRDNAELQLHHQVEKTSDIERAVALEEMNMATLASARQQDEVRRARHKVRTAEQQLERELEQEQAEAAERDRRQADADRLQREGKKRLAKEQKRTKEKDANMQELRDAEFDHKAKRHTQLKDSITRISNTIHAENERRRKQQAAKLTEQDIEKKELIAAGLNPYEVFRRRELEKEQLEQKVKAAALKEMRQEHLIEKVEQEDLRERKQEVIDRDARARAGEFQREMGGLERRRKVTKYIRDQTIGHVDVLDPTGTAMRIDPSTVTVQQTKDFGLGRAPPELIAKKEKALAKQSLELKQGRTDGDDDDFGFEGEGDEQEEKQRWQPKLTKLEKQYMSAAALRQKENITSVQKCWGREFSGQAFLAQPAVIAFTDFEVGQRYKKVIQITNVSLTFNQFKLLPLDDMINDFFEIEFHPPGRMSAGTTCSLTLWFLPKKNRDIYTEFPILSKTGPISFPLQATTKKTVLQMTPQNNLGEKIIDFGDVLLGEDRNKQLTVINSGAKTSDFTLHMGDSEFVQKMITAEPPEKFHAKKTTKLPFNFKPTKVGMFETKIRIEVHNPYVDDQFVVVKGTCVDVPIYVEHESYDFKTIIAGHVFRENVVIHNRRAQPMTIQVVKPKQIEHELSYIPALAYIQGNSRMVIQFKLSLKHDFLTRYPQYKNSDDTHSNAFRIPVKIRGSDQELPVWTTLHGTLTTNDLTFDPPQIHFGNCFVESCTMQEVRIKNESLLPQKFAFVRMPPYLSVQVLPFDAVADEMQEDKLQRLGKEHPHDGQGWGWTGGIQSDACVDGGGFGGFGTLLPQEKMRLLVAYTPQSAVEMNTTLSFKVQSASLCAREFQLPCRGQGVLPALEFSARTVEMAAVPPLALIKESIEVTNTSKVPQKMNLLIPPEQLARLAVCPVCCVVEPRETKRIQFEFRPNDDYVNYFEAEEEAAPVEEHEEHEEDEEAKPEEEPPAPVEAPEKDEQQKEQEEILVMAKKAAVRRAGGRRWIGSGRSHHALWKIPVCVMPADKKEQGSYKSMYLAVRTTTVPNVLTADPHEVNFQEVTVKQRVVRRIAIRNVNSKTQSLRMDPLPENACFVVLDALREVKDRPFQIVVAFTPEFAQVYSTVLRLYSEDTRIQVQLKGKGVRPVLEIEPESGVVDFGAVTYQDGQDYIAIPIKVKNASPFEMHYSLDTDMVTDSNPFGVQPFTVTPGTATVAGNEFQEVIVKFQPHRPWAGYRHRLLVNVPNQQKKTYFSFYGMCFKYQMYCVYNTPVTQLETLERTPVFQTSLKMEEQVEPEVPKDPKAKPDIKAAAPLTFDLVFDEKNSTEDQLKLYLVVGCAVPPGTRGQAKDGAGGSATFAVQPSTHSKYFAVEPTNVNVGLGKQEKVCFTFTPPKERDLTLQGLTLDLLDDIGQWVSTTVKGSLKGGYAPPGMPAEQEVTVNLRAYLCQI